MCYTIVVLLEGGFNRKRNLSEDITVNEVQASRNKDFKARDSQRNSADRTQNIFIIEIVSLKLKILSLWLNKAACLFSQLVVVFLFLTLLPPCGCYAALQYLQLQCSHIITPQMQYGSDVEVYLSLHYDCVSFVKEKETLVISSSGLSFRTMEANQHGGEEAI